MISNDFLDSKGFLIFSPFLPVLNGKTETASIPRKHPCLQEHRQGRSMIFCSNEFLLRISFTGFCVNLSCTCCGNVRETTHMASRVCQIWQGDFSPTCHLAPHVVLHPVSGICSSQSISWPKCCNNTGLERHPSIVAITTSETELSSHAPLKMCGKLKQQEAERMKQTSGSTRSGLYGKIGIGTLFIHVTETFAHPFASGKDKASDNTKRRWRWAVGRWVGSRWGVYSLKGPNRYQRFL